MDDDDIVKYLDFDDLNSIADGAAEKEAKVADDVAKRAGAKDLYLELALFLDQKGYELFMPHVKSEENLVDLLLGFVNQVRRLIPIKLTRYLKKGWGMGYYSLCSLLILCSVV